MDQIDLSDGERSHVRVILEMLDDCGDELVDRIRKSLLLNVFENRFTLHPRRIQELSRQEVERLINFLKTLRIEQAIDRGKKLNNEGIGKGSLQLIGRVLRQFIFEQLKDKPNTHLLTANKILDLYSDQCFFGYMEEWEHQILHDQEQLRRALSTALEKQRQELIIKNHAIHTSTTGIMLTDLDGLINYVNPSFLHMWDVKNTEKLLRTGCSRFLGNRDFRFIVDELMKRGGWQQEFSTASSNGSQFDIFISASMIRNDQYEPIGVMASFSDVTERKRLEAQFRQAQKMDALGQLAGGIVHDFNNLLQVISGYAELGLMQLPENSEQYKNYMQIKVASERGNELTQQLRFFTRHSSSKMQPTNLNNVVQETHNLMMHTLLQDIEIELRGDPELMSVRADSSQLIQVLLNLCVNARDAIRSKVQESGRTISSASSAGLIIIETFNIELNNGEAGKYLQGNPGTYACLRISDNGIGIEPRNMDRLFEPFFTTKGQKSGTGLGLAVVYGIVQNHKGFIDVESLPGKGSSFSIFLPVIDEELEVNENKTPNPSLVRGKGTVLVVEDEHQVRDLAKHALEVSGYRVLFAQDGKQALSIFEQEGDSIDLVVLDMVMPVMGGKECFYRLKELNPHLKILIMTGYTADGSLEDFRQNGALGIIEKPFDLELFTQSVHEAIGT
jgi:two-component system cell cycle sensor histidine kinase/response regulator CckA